MALKSLVSFGTVANDNTGDPLRTGAIKLSAPWSKTYVATAAQFGGTTKEVTITNTIVAAVADGALYVLVPAKYDYDGSAMLPYNAALVTFNNAAKMTREGGNPFNFDVRAYGWGAGGASDTAAIAAAGAAANADTSSFSSYLPSSGFPYGTNVWGVTFNGVVDNAYGVTYNELVGDPNGPGGKVGAGEPDWRWAWESHYYDGAQHWIELNWDITSIDGLRTDRVVAFQYNRTTYGTGWAFTCLYDATGRTGSFVLESAPNSGEINIVPRAGGSDASVIHAYIRTFCGGGSRLLQIGGDGSGTAPTNVQLGPEVTGGTGLHIVAGAPAFFQGKGFGRSRVVPAYGVSVTINGSLGDVFEIVPTDGVAFTVAIPISAVLNAARSQRITIRIKNTFGVLGAATWTGGAGGYRLGAAWTQPANGFSRSITFQSDGTNWIETDRTAVDVTN